MHRRHLQILSPMGMLAFLLLWVASPLSTFGAEKITAYHTGIVVEPNGDLVVTETINVNAEGRKIKRGIYRDIPISFKDKQGRIKKVGFEILTIMRDGQPEDYHTEYTAKTIRIYIGNKDIILRPGAYTYTIRYRTDRQLRFFEHHDELFWNAIGTEWQFPIEFATATIELPEGIVATDTFVYTGSYGTREKNAQSTLEQNGRIIHFAATQKLPRRHGMSIGIKMPKGSLDPVPEGKAWEWWWRDFRAEAIAFTTLILASLFYFVRWWQIGRDPPTGVIVPRWDPPDDISPALADYITQKGFGSRAYRAMTAALLNLAVKGFVEIENPNDKPNIIRNDKPINEKLPVGEARLIEILEARPKRSIKASKANGKSIQSLHDKFSEAVTSEHRDAFYRHNFGSIFIGLFISVVGLIAVFASGGVHPDILTGLIAVVTLCGVVIILLINLLPSIRPNAKIASRISALIFLGGMGLAIVGGLIYLAFMLTDYIPQPYLLLALAGLVILNGLFFILLGAPTPLGREKMDILAGLKQYIGLAEQDRINLAGSPQMSPQHFETLLPYAVAFGLEKPWSKAFSVWLASAVAAGTAAAYYGPSWYRGRDRFSTDNLEESMADLPTSIENSFTQSLPVSTSSSSGSSGGFSGGGGGGGGGGGW